MVIYLLWRNKLINIWVILWVSIWGCKMLQIRLLRWQCYLEQYRYCSFSCFFIWADLVIRCKVLLFEASPQCHREPPNQVSHLKAGIGNRKLVCDRPFAPLLRICSSPRAPSPICALLSGTVQRKYVGGLIWPRKVYVGSFPVVRGQEME